jgi:poly(A) polymerase
MSSPVAASHESARTALAKLLEPGSPVMDVAERFAAGGRVLYLVGGAVRDAFSDRSLSTRELDLATDAPPPETRALLEGVASALWRQGEPFGTIGAEVGGVRLEITTFRTERYVPDSRHPEVAFGTDVTTDLSRRDFTINAVAIKLPERKLIDPFGGLADLRDRVIKTPGDPRSSLLDDPLRILRAFRFISQLASKTDGRVLRFDIDEGLLDAAAQLRDRLLTVSAERVRDELAKLLVGSAPAQALGLADRAGVVELILPEVAKLKLEQDPVHRHKDVWLHTLAVLEQTEPDEVLRLAALLHDIGKPQTRRIGPEGVTFHFHEVVGADAAARRLRALRWPKRVVDEVRTLIRLHHRFHTYRLGWSDAAVRRYARDAGPLLKKLNALVRADCTTRNREKALRLQARMDELEARIGRLAQQEELERIRPELDGHAVMSHLGVPPGPFVGEALEYLLEIRLEEGLIGRSEALKRLEEWARDRLGDRADNRGDRLGDRADNPRGVEFPHE